MYSIFTIIKLIYQNTLVLIMQAEKMKKTTVSFPINVLKGLHEYIGKHNLTSHDQSKIVALALWKFLEADGIAVDSNNKEMIDFEVTLKSEAV